MTTMRRPHGREARRICMLLAILTVLAARPGPAEAASSDVASAARDAVTALKSAAGDSLLVKDMLGARVTGPKGEAIGRVEDFVVVPGGRMVAAIVATGPNGKNRLPVPFSLVKVSRKAGGLGLALPVGLAELKGMKEVRSLAGALPSVR